MRKKKDPIPTSEDREHVREPIETVRARMMERLVLEAAPRASRARGALGAPPAPDQPPLARPARPAGRDERLLLELDVVQVLGLPVTGGAP